MNKLKLGEKFIR